MLRIVKTPGNGDCFYHAVMLNIIHDALHGKLTNQSAQAIQTLLFPAIVQQLLDVGGPELDETTPPRQFILDLLRTAPATAIGIQSEINEDDSEEVRAIKQSDVYHLLRDVCAPAQRRVMLQAAKSTEVKKAIKKALKNECLDYLDNGHINEFSDIDAALTQPMRDTWTRLRREDSISTTKQVFNNWWEQNQDTAADTYMSFHAQPHIQAGGPQQVALSQALHCNFETVHKTNGNINPLNTDLPLLDNANSFRLQNIPGHYDAQLGQPATPVTEAMETCMHNFIENSGELHNVQFPWSVTSIASEDVRSAINSIHQTRNLINENPAWNQSLEQLTELQKETISTAREGYQGKLNNTLFGNTVREIKKITQPLDERTQQEASDFLFAVKLQNEEIESDIRAITQGQSEDYQLAKRLQEEQDHELAIQLHEEEKNNFRF